MCPFQGLVSTFRNRFRVKSWISGEVEQGKGPLPSKRSPDTYLSDQGHFREGMLVPDEEDTSRVHPACILVFLQSLQRQGQPLNHVTKLTDKPYLTRLGKSRSAALPNIHSSHIYQPPNFI